MLYKYFIGTGETDIISVDQVYELYRKGMISKTSKLYDVEKNMYVEAYEVPEFIDVFLERYSNESKASKLLKYIISTVFFLMFMLVGMINAFLNLGMEKMKNDTTNSLLYLIGIFFGMGILITLIIFISAKFFKRHSSIIIIASSIILFAVSTFFLIATVKTINTEKTKKMQMEKAALMKIIEFYEAVLTGNAVNEDVSAGEYGDYAPLVSETYNYVLTLNHMNSEISYLFKDIPLSQIIIPEMLNDIERIRQNRESAKVVINELVESKNQNSSVHDTYANKIENIAVPESIREEFVAAIKKNCEEEKKEKDVLYDLNIKLFEKIDEICKYFEDRAGKYNIENNMIIFNEKNDEDNYKKLVQEYEALLKQYSEEAKIILKNDENNINYLKELVEKNYLPIT
ncbi:hypothetical protein [Acetivibrio clariflavus]|uniref:Uncharacterized protein n=1 Tax=Acetivibrio clariflavus (strain DSM 19732 / NBRC 101661 / EBR45) TaxID=720554 RepID=G8M1P9_ACECE|nr:hypothetical protein [Acetivibrio clariflavus]AEV70278.1 hypothetical protein Clocl_3828 [Acetivibrio clariflavus DSM 19732]